MTIRIYYYIHLLFSLDYEHDDVLVFYKYKVFAGAIRFNNRRTTCLLKSKKK